MALFNFEYKDRPLASSGEFVGRVVGNLLFAAIMLVIALGGGTAGYRFIVGLDWLDAFLEASMILSGMGPVAELTTDGGKLFAGVYALVSGLLFVVTAGLVLAPVLHRVLHALHIDDDPR